MNREQAINYLISCGFTEEQLSEVVRALTYQPTTKNDLGVDTDKLIADCEKMSFDFELFGRPMKALLLDAVKNIVKDLPSVTPQEPQTFKWCTDCKEYDQEKHCCHRWSKVIRDTVEEIKQEQEPVIDKIRAEIEKLQKMCDKNDLNLMAQYSAFGMVLDILDKYKVERSVEDGENNN